MTYPLLRLARDQARVVVREGHGAQRWEEMTQVHDGPARKGADWKAGEGRKLAASYCMWPDDPGSQLSLPVQVSGWEGLGTGQAEIRVFPETIDSLAASLADVEQSIESHALILHEDPRSGNCYKIKLTAALLGLPLATRQYDIMAGETRTPAFLAAVNGNGRIPVLQVGNRFLPESNAACFYLAEDSRLVPEDRFDRADMLRWMFFEQYNHEPNVATLRFWLRFVGEGRLSEQQKTQIPAKRIAGCEALGLMDRHLLERDWFVGEAATLADIALYAYTHVAEEGGFGLTDYPSIRRWLDRVARLPGYVPMQ